MTVVGPLPLGVAFFWGDLPPFGLLVVAVAFLALAGSIRLPTRMGDISATSAIWFAIAIWAVEKRVWGSPKVAPSYNSEWK